MSGSPVISRTVSPSIETHAKGFAESFGLDTSYRTLFDSRDPPFDDYERDLKEAQSILWRFVSTHPTEPRIVKLRERLRRHSLIIDGDHNWEDIICEFERHLGPVTLRLTTKNGFIDKRQAIVISRIWATLTSLKALGFFGSVPLCSDPLVSRILRESMTQLATENLRNLTHIVWRCSDVDIIPIIPGCIVLEILDVDFMTTYDPETISRLSGSVLTNLHTLRVSLKSYDMGASNLFTLLALCILLALRALIVISDTAAKDLNLFLSKSGKRIKFIRTTETSTIWYRHVDISFPHVMSLWEFEASVQTAGSFLTVSKPHLTHLAIACFPTYAQTSHSLRMDNVRDLVRILSRLHDHQIHPKLKLVRLLGFEAVMFKTTRWFAYEQVAFYLIARTLNRRKIAWEDQNRVDLHKEVVRCNRVLENDGEFECGENDRF